MNKNIGTGTLITDIAKIQEITGDDQEYLSEFSGIILYENGNYIHRLNDGRYVLHILNDIYTDKDLSKLEPILEAWVESELNYQQEAR